MNSQFQEQFILPSPAGAYYCINSSEAEPARFFLQQLMTQNETLTFNTDTISNIFSTLSSTKSDVQDDVIYHLKKLKFLQKFEQVQPFPKGNIEESLPDILKLLSSNGKALLADNQGFYLSGSGFTHEASEELSAMSGDLGSLYSRHQGIIHGNLNINSSAFALVDSGGYSQLGFWPLYIGDLLFMLVISGVPRFDQDAFVKLIWILHKNYYVYHSSADSDAA